VAHKHHASLTPLATARALLLDAAPRLATVERVSTADALGRVTATACHARFSVPHYHGAAMDGIAVRARDTIGASAAAPVELEYGTPSTTSRPFSWVDTGNALPSWADAVIMIERVHDGPGRRSVELLDARHGAAEIPRRPAAQPANDDCCATDDDAAATTPSDAPPTPGTSRIVHVTATAAPWQHVRLVGEDVVAGDVLLSRGREIRPHDVGALLAAGLVEVDVRPRPRVAILPTGDELIEPDEPRRPGRIVEFNSRMIAAFVREWGGEPVRLAPVGDNVDAVRSRLTLALREADVVCVIAGSSAGEHDFTAAALASVGEIAVHGVAVMPGKPAIVATIAETGDATAAGVAPRARIAIGVPGYPVSAAVICRELLAPLLAHLVGRAAPEDVTVTAITPHALSSRLGQEELMRVCVGEVAGRRVICPLPRGAGAISTMARADGIVRLGADVEQVPAGGTVEIELLRPLADVRGTILVAGSHDPALAVLEDVLRASAPEYRIALSPVGGAAGLDALARGEVHAAAICGALTESVPGRVVRLARRAVGLVVAAGNPLGIRTLDDLQRADVRTPPEVERSAVRLSSRTLAEPGHASAANGADGEHDAPSIAHGSRHGGGAQQELSPLAVAAAVQSGLADVGIATAAAAAALGSDFVPLADEDYVLVLREDFAATVAGRALVETAHGAAFAAALGVLPGYGAQAAPADTIRRA
jgi:putative molybdopterin biosynthesis protein